MKKPVEVINEYERKERTAAFRVQAVKRVLAGHAVAAVARELGIGESLLNNGVTRHRLTESTGALQAEQAAEIARLKRALAQKEEEAAI
jgi:transposase-like protein